MIDSFWTTQSSAWRYLLKQTASCAGMFRNSVPTTSCIFISAKLIGIHPFWNIDIAAYPLGHDFVSIQCVRKGKR
jgi:hypothetical protein